MAATRPYRSPLRARQAEQTRQDILAAARTAFAADGYTATTIRAVAARAEVTEQTVYATFGSKGGLALALVDYANEVAGVVELGRAADAATNPHDLLAGAIHLVCVLHERVGDLIMMLLEAGRVDSALAPALEAGRAHHAGPQRRIAERLAREGALREDVDVDTAAGLLTVSTGPEAIDRYVSDLGWTYAQVEERLTPAVLRSLCRPEVG